LNEDQFKVAYVIIRKLKEWVELLKKTESERKQFKPLRMTVVGCAGTGKSVLINTVVGYIRKIFQDNNSVIVAAPTGAAAHNVGGQTLHREFKIGIGKNKKRNLSKSKNGAYHFIQLGGTTMELEQIIRQNNDQEELRDVLRNTRVGHPSDNNVETILALHLNSGNFTMEEIEELESKALYVFANKKQMRQHNFERLKAQHSSENPIARLRVQAVSKGREINNLPKCFKQENDIDPIVNICRGAKVQLMGKNFEPDWGLYNGSIGTVKEIVFERDENPLDGTLPQYVLVDFPEYCGPPWLKDKPKWVPIPPVELQCQSHCCNVKFIPLTLAYAKTGHTFQGQSAGPGHVIPCIIIQPGSSKMEKLCPGLLYMLLSRGSTIGTPECRLTSSIFLKH